jgi:hypothetical protein
MTNAEFEQLALQQQPCSTVWIRCLNNLAELYSGEHDDVGSYITVLQTAALVPQGAHHARYTHVHISHIILHTINIRAVHDLHALCAVISICAVDVSHVLRSRQLQRLRHNTS